MRTEKRYRALDGIRGAAAASMILYHAAWDAANLLNIYMPWFYSGAAYIWQQSICWTFILLSGFCWRLGSHRLRRALAVSGAGLLVTAATALFMPSNVIIFGILTLLGACMLLMLPLDRLFSRVDPVIGLFLASAAFFITRNINYGTLGFENIIIAYLPRDALYKNTFTAFFGFPPYTFQSGDYFSLFPWIFLFTAGYFLYGIFNKTGAMNILRKGFSRPLEFAGRHALIIYLIHQPALYAVTEIINYFRP